MAITIEQAPDSITPVYNKVEYLISSTNSGNTDFSYLVDIYINGSGTKTARLRIPIRPSDSYGIVDIHRVLETTLTSDVGDTTSILGNNDAPNHALTYIVKIGEEYDPGTGIITQYPPTGGGIDSTRTAINASLEKQEWIDWDWAEYNTGQATDKYLTNSPSSRNVSIEDHGWLYHSNSLIHDRYNVETYDSSGASLGSWVITASSTSVITYVASAPASLNLIDNANLSTGVQPIITTSTGSYSITPHNVVLARGETKTFVIKEPCKFNANNLIFLNKLGGFDHFTFYNGDSSSYSIQRKTMKVNIDTVSGTTISHSMQDREKVQYYTKQTETIKLMSDWITEEEDAWLLELIESPEIYLQNGNDLIAVSNIKTTSHTKKKDARDKLFRLDVELELGYDNYRQRG